MNAGWPHWGNVSKAVSTFTCGHFWTERSAIVAVSRFLWHTSSSTWTAQPEWGAHSSRFHLKLWQLQDFDSFNATTWTWYLKTCLEIWLIFSCRLGDCAQGLDVFVYKSFHFNVSHDYKLKPLLFNSRNLLCPLKLSPFLHMVRIFKLI